jgi:hypothetical protein
VLKGLRRRAKEFGYELTEVGVAAGVSQEKVTGLTVPQVHLLLMAVLPRRDFDTD